MMINKGTSISIFDMIYNLHRIHTTVTLQHHKNIYIILITTSDKYILSVQSTIIFHGSFIVKTVGPTVLKWPIPRNLMGPFKILWV